MRQIVALALAAGLAVAGCGDDDPGDDAATTTSASDQDATDPGNSNGNGNGNEGGIDGSYLLLAAEGWELQEAVDPAADDPIATIERPPLLWYAEYEQGAADTPSRVRVSGHDGDLAAVLDALVPGFGFEDRTIDGRPALVGRGNDPLGPSVVVLEHGTTSVMVLSYELPVEQLADLATRVEEVDEAGWAAAGGVSGRRSG